MREMFGRVVAAQEYDRLPLGVEGEERAQVTAEGGQLFHVVMSARPNACMSATQSSAATKVAVRRSNARSTRSCDR
jgi:hypothetical protein